MSTPMSPGSPPSHGQAHSSPFLPGYLLGDHPAHHSSMGSPRPWSSGGSQSQSSGSHKLGGQGSTPAMGLIRQNSTRRTGGPPIKSLYSSPPDLHNQSAGPGGPTPQGLHVMTPASPAPPTTGLFSSPSLSRGDTSLCLNKSQSFPLSPAQSDPFYTQELKSDDPLDDTWVTVFGFPPGATSFILQQFSQYGTILKHVVASECNWMHLHYQSKIQAKKALSKDGKIYGGCMKIGVTPCIEKTIMEEKENPGNLSSITLDTSFKSPCDTSVRTTPMRPLTAAYSASKGEYEVLQDKQTPKRDAGLVSKLKEYMLGY